MFGIKTVVIDAGHGGHDVGCMGSSAKEKNIVLGIALNLGEMIEKNFPEVRVIYTRKTDVFIELHERAGIANRAKADLFICIHCNSACTRDSRTRKDICNESIHGAETYVMGLHKTEDNLSVARRENSSVLLEKDYQNRYDGYDPNSPEANIIFSLFQNAYMNQSISFASKVQNEFEEYSGRNNRGVKQAGFLVLYRTAMPSVLIETGFLTNGNEEKYLLSEKGQTNVATSIFRAFKEYKIDMEGEYVQDVSNKNEVTQTSDPVASANKEKGKSLIKETKKDTALTEMKKKSEDPVKPKEITTQNTAKDSDSNKKAISAPEPVVDSSAKSNMNTDKPALVKEVVKTEDSKVEANVKVKKTEPEKPTLKTDLIFFTVQIGAASTGTTQGLEKYSKVEDLKKVAAPDGMTRFTVGNFKNMNDAIIKQGEMRSKGFKDAFITAYHNGTRITLKEATELMKKN